MNREQRRKYVDVVVNVPSLPLIERDALPPFPESIEARLFHEPGLEPAIVLYNPAAELYVLMALTDTARIDHHVEQLQAAVAKQVMGEPAPDENGYRTGG